MTIYKCMKKIYHSLIMVFSMYTKLPMPIVDWNAENKAYAFALFPLVGAVEMILLLAVYCIFQKLQVKNEIFSEVNAIVLTVLPILYTGGIHMDGFMDTCDALGSHANLERKLEIMKDSHVGSVAVLAAIFYVLLYYLGMSKIQFVPLLFFGISLIVERALSVLMLLHFPIAKKSKMAADFVHSSQRKHSKGILTGFLVISTTALFIMDAKRGSMILLYFFVLCSWYVHKMKKEVGGLTGDTSGFFLQIGEVGVLWLILLCSG